MRSGEVNSIMVISVYLSNLEDTVPLFHSLFALFERTFSDATSFHWWINNEAEAFMPSVNNLRDFVNLEKLVVGEGLSCQASVPLSYNTRIQSYFPQ